MRLPNLNRKIMKIKILMAAALCAALGFSSCDGGDSKLAGELVGSWKGNTAEMIKSKKEKPDKKKKDDREKGGDRDRKDYVDREEMTCTPTFTFVRTDGTNGGTLNISADYTVTKGVESIMTKLPINAIIDGNVKASGTWTVKDGDEIIVNLDPSKTVVEVDTASLVLSYARLTDAPQDSLNAIKDRVAANISNAVKPMLTGRVKKIRKFDDVKVVGNTMKLEAGHNKLSFTKQ